MTNIKSIITKYQTQLQNAGLLRQATAAQLSPQVARMRPSLAKVRAALAERPDRFAVKAFPMSVLFDLILPKIEYILVGLGEERAEEIISQLCEHGKAMIKEHGIDGSREHLEELFKDLPDYESKLKEETGIEEIISAYLRLDGSYLQLKLGEKIEKIETDENGMISLKMRRETNNSDLIHLQRVTSLQKLHLEGTQVSDITPLSGLSRLQNLNLTRTQVSDVTPLRSLTSLQKLYLAGTEVNDVTPLSGLISLQTLILEGARISYTQIEELKRAIPGVEIKR